MSAPASPALAAGARVLIPAVLSCGHCTLCRSGRENICENSQMLGNHIDGGYAEYVAVPAKDVVHMPDDVPLVEGSIIADAVTTPYHAVVRRGRVTPGDWVAVFGCGGVGLSLVQIASAVGGRVIAVDVKDAKLETALRFGATAVFNASDDEEAGQGDSGPERRRRQRGLRGGGQGSHAGGGTQLRSSPAAGWCWSGTAPRRCRSTPAG